MKEDMRLLPKDGFIIAHQNESVNTFFHVTPGEQAGNPRAIKIRLALLINLNKIKVRHWTGTLDLQSNAVPLVTAPACLVTAVSKLMVIQEPAGWCFYHKDIQSK
ncbi:hypothetical protein AVEN_55452-1 [Araneus ventricosus]|uniref:Uncharacterized protein n=1 Tax=Araneus ventricosus TaxID=182803 RepID=A0A4Y2H9L5_ARAVE|nr:hypothetical protein AVEN_55452-1 [Araneus ventricosus]